MMVKTIISGFDFSGNWSGPYREAGYDVIQVDLKHGKDIRLAEHVGRKAYGIILAPPCTAFAGSGAQYWPDKDQSGQTLASLALVDAGLRLVAIHRPHFWVLENPVGRLRKWLGEPTMIFNPCDFGDPYTKRTCLWGEFCPPLPLFIGGDKSVDPIRACSQGSWIQTLGGKSERTKELRSATPRGFSRAFFEANR